MNRRILQRVVVYGVLGIAAAGMFLMRRTLWRRLVIGAPAAALEHVPTVDGALSAYSKKSDKRFRLVCQRAGTRYPPRRVTLVAFKEEKLVEVWGADDKGPYKRLAVYPVLAASGVSGPKRQEGDRQVPEGFYRISALNPASQFHLSLRVNYPNAEDIAHRTVPQGSMGGDIYVHGGAASIGCLALGDPAIEEVFCLVVRANPAERRIIIAPQDLRASHSPRTSDPWLRDLYSRIRTALRRDFAV
jgi:murein L,D-transpeptidase YafK